MYNNLVDGYTPLSPEINGCLKMPNGYMDVWGAYPMKGLSSYPTSGGFGVQISLENYGFLGDVWTTVSPRYSAGFPKVSHVWNDTTKSITLLSDVAVSGGYIQWRVAGRWK